jgi:hypothetical protein
LIHFRARLRRLAPWLAMLALAVAQAAEPPGKILKNRWQRAAHFYNAGFYEEAAQELKEILAIVPDDHAAQQYYRRATKASAFGTILNDEMEEKRSFDLSPSSGPAAGPFQDLPGIGPRPAPSPNGADSDDLPPASR